MKKSKAFSLEADIIDKIFEYQKRKGLSSASAALERIILVELPKGEIIDELEDIKGILNGKVILSDNEVKNETEEKESDNIDFSWQNSMATIKD